MGSFPTAVSTAGTQRQGMHAHPRFEISQNVPPIGGPIVRVCPSDACPAPAECATSG